MISVSGTACPRISGKLASMLPSVCVHTASDGSTCSLAYWTKNSLFHAHEHNYVHRNISGGKARGCTVGSTENFNSICGY